jgi:hypothetical protein
LILCCRFDRLIPFDLFGPCFLFGLFGLLHLLLQLIRCCLLNLCCPLILFGRFGLFVQCCRLILFVQCCL